MLIANVGVVVGIIFLAIEVRSNTASNRIAIETAWSSSWVNINTGTAQSPELANAIAKAQNGSQLSSGEVVQVRQYVRALASQASLMRRLYVQGYATRPDVERAYMGLRGLAEHDAFRQEIEQLGTSGPIVLEEGGLEKWFESVD